MAQTCQREGLEEKDRERLIFCSHKLLYLLSLMADHPQLPGRDFGAMLEAFHLCVNNFSDQDAFQEYLFSGRWRVTSSVDKQVCVGWVGGGVNGWMCMGVCVCVCVGVGVCVRGCGCLIIYFLCVIITYHILSHEVQYLSHSFYNIEESHPSLSFLPGQGVPRSFSSRAPAEA